MSHIHEVDAAERARAAAGGGVYHFGAPTGGGYAVAGGPVVVGHVKAPETDAQRIARLSEEVGRLTAELREVRAELKTERNGGKVPKGSTGIAEVQYGNGSAIVAYSGDSYDHDDGSTTDEVYVDAVWIGGQWVPCCELGAFGEELNERLPAALED